MLAALLKDVYKVFHPFAYNPKVSGVFANYTNRFNRHSNVPNSEYVVAVGMQYVVISFLFNKWNEFFTTPKGEVVAEYKRVTSSVLGKEIGVEHIAALHDLRYLPIEVRAIEEGSLVPYGVPTLTVESTVDGFGWVTNMLETQISTMLWPIQTAATTAYAYRKRFEEEPSLDKEFIKFLGHDFSYRGLSDETGKVGFGHLCSFFGSDTFPAGYFAEKYYGARFDKELVMASVDATEHSVMCSYMQEGEKESLKHLMTNVSPTGILSIVSDTWDFWKLVTEYLPDLKETIMSRDGKVVIRPDSGDPVDILCGKDGGVARPKCWQDFMLDAGDDVLVEIEGTVYLTQDIESFQREYSWDTFSQIAGNLSELIENGLLVEVDAPTIPEWERKGLIECLWDTFGGTICEKTGLKKLDPHIGAIYGDSITLERQDQIIKRLKAKGFAPEVVLGIGSFTYQYVTRDTHGSAIKATAVKMDGEWVGIQKSPKTDNSKKSAKGFIKVIEQDGKLVAVDGVSYEEFKGEDNLLKPIFRGGFILSYTTLAAIREKIDSTFK